MGIRFRCHACHKKLNVKSYLAGKRGFCPECGAKIQIPLESDPEFRQSGASQDSAAAATATPAATGSPARKATAGEEPAEWPSALREAPEATWYLYCSEVNQQFGPAKAQEIYQWLTEGRIVEGHLLWREEWPEWLPAADVFPHLRSSAPQASPVPMPDPAIAPGAASYPTSPASQPAANRPAHVPVVTPAVSAGAAAMPYPLRKRTPMPMVAALVGLAILVIVLAGILAWVLIRGNAGTTPSTGSLQAASGVPVAAK